MANGIDHPGIVGLPRLLLVMPPQQGLLNGFAAGLISLANFVQREMPEIKLSVLDLSLHTIDAAIEAIRHAFRDDDSAGPLVVGITTTTASYQSALAVARAAKTMTSRSVVVLGGHHASADPKTILRSHPDCVDFIVIGEGERTLCSLLRALPAHGPLVSTREGWPAVVEGIRGLAFIDPASGDFVCNGSPIPLSQDELDAIPITYGSSHLIGTPGKFNQVTYVSARGCPLQCAFCAVGQERIRAKSISAVVRDIELLLDMGFTRIAIEDNFFAHSPARTRDICNVLAEIQHARLQPFLWDCQTRVESLARRDTISLLSRAGCAAVYIGVESVHPEQLRYLNKSTNPSAYIRSLVDIVVPALLEAGIACYLNLQFGLPGETDHHERSTHGTLAALGQLAHAHGTTITVFPQLHVVYPGTTHFAQGVAEGNFPATVFEEFTEWESEQSPVLYWLGEHFAHGTGGIPQGILKADLLRHGRFSDKDEVVDANAVFRISAALRAIDRIDGVRTFNYGDYIVTGDCTTVETQMTAKPALRKD